MSLSAREKLGPYEIVALIGVGGMGEVYRARDPRLGRDVAIKISAERFTERFEREARAIASLNHPNICTLYDVGPNYLVMELVEGPTLAERIAEGPLPLDEALRIARQIADALEAAHEAQVIHRDLKPGNIKIKPDGSVKVLDFGLAKVGGTPTVPTADSPTFTMATQVGAILGTAAYMAPEQAKGKPVDKRADIWAFGVVLYEMLTGAQAFTGETVTDVMASVVKEQPGFAALPVQVRAVVARCLSKDPRSRWRDIGDVRWALDHVDEGPQLQAAPAHPLWPWIIAACVLALAAPATWFLKPKPDQPLLQVEITAPEGTKFGSVSLAQLALSPDGRRLAFLATGKDGKKMLWVRPLAATGATALAGTENADRPFWSPDSRWVGFHAAGKLQKIDVTGGPPQVICETTAAGSGTWNSDGVILFSDIFSGSMPIQRVSAAGGTPTPVFSLDTTREENSQNTPWFLPDGRYFLFLSRSKESGIVLGSLDGKTRRFLIAQTNSPATYAPNPAGGGWILHTVGNTLMARPFDPGKGEFTGEAAAIRSRRLAPEAHTRSTAAPGGNQCAPRREIGSRKFGPARPFAGRPPTGFSGHRQGRKEHALDAAA